MKLVRALRMNRDRAALPLQGRPGFLLDCTYRSFSKRLFPRAELPTLHRANGTLPRGAAGVSSLFLTFRPDKRRPYLVEQKYITYPIHFDVLFKRYTINANPLGIGERRIV